MITIDQILPVGKFQKTHALKGELNMISNVDPQYFLEGNPLIVDYDGIFVPYFVESVRPKGSTSYLVKLSGVDSGEEASRFVNKEISILRKDAEEWLEEEMLIENAYQGFSIIDDSTGNVIGTLTSIDDSTSNILFLVSSDDGRIIYLPANDDLIKKIDEPNRVIVMTVPEGLLDLNQ